MGGVWIEGPGCDGLIFAVAFKVRQDDLGWGVFGKDIAGEWHVVRYEDKEANADDLLHGYAEHLTAMRG